VVARPGLSLTAFCVVESENPEKAPHFLERGNISMGENVV